MHVFLGVDTPDALRAAFEAATAAGGDAVVEAQLAGRDYRVLSSAARSSPPPSGSPAHVVGDGASDGRRADRPGQRATRAAAIGHARALTRIKIDDCRADHPAARQGLGVDAVPAAGQQVLLRENGQPLHRRHRGDVTDARPPRVAGCAGGSPRIVGLDIAGIDLRLPDDRRAAAPDRDSEQRRGDRGERRPGLRMHLDPTTAQPRDVGDAIVERCSRRAPAAIPSSRSPAPTARPPSTRAHRAPARRRPA